MREQKQNWHCLQFAVPQVQSEDIAACCFELGSCGLQVEDEGETARLTAYFAAEYDSEHIRAKIEERLLALGLVETDVESEALEDQDWEEEWRRFFKPVWATPRIVVHASWIPVEVAAGQFAIVIDPKMAFGTGGHESTQLCLEALEKISRADSRCLDLGTGSGILSIAAVKMGAMRVLALDIDAQAVENARENLLRNGVDPEKVDLRQGGIEAGAGQLFDLVLANIQSHVLRPLLPQIDGLLGGGGQVIFSGLLAREEVAFCKWVRDAGLEVDEVLCKNNWIAVVARRV